MRIEYQLQIDAIKGNRIYYKEYGDLTFITDGHIGVYLSKSELKITKEKMIAINDDKCSFDPVILLQSRTKARETRIARKLFSNNEFAILIKSTENDEECFVNQKFLKMFYGFNALYIKSRKDPVLVYKLGQPYGVILPMNILPEE